MAAKIIKPPEPLPVQRVKGIVPRSIFLAGSIEMGKAEDWQAIVTKEVSSYTDYIFNPRRENWDSSWTQSINNEQFNTQVSWELTAQDISQVILMYFVEDSKSPISLLELGLYANSGKMIVCCPQGFYRRGNVEMVCNRFKIPLYGSLESSFYDLPGKMCKI